MSRIIFLISSVFIFLYDRDSQAHPEDTKCRFICLTSLDIYHRQVFA